MKWRRWAQGAFLFLLIFFALHQHRHCDARYAYIGPGAGFAFLGSFFTLLASIAASIASVLAWPFRLLWLILRRRGRFGKAVVKKAIFLGLDGLDPKLTERWMEEGKLPNMKRLRDSGYYQRLRTTFPPLSPVAWSTFATGVNPGKHNIFDFLNRDLRTYAPELSSAKVRPARRVLKFGRWKLALSRPTVELRRKSEPFWKILSRNAVQSTILRVPITFPPERFHGKLLSAMCTPDLLGTQGTFSRFSMQREVRACEGGNHYPLRESKGGWEGDLSGPEGTSIPFQVLGEGDKRTLVIGGRRWMLRQGEYTPWIRLRFRTGPLSWTKGIARFLLTSADPVSIYVSPVEIDPERPALPMSHPHHYAIYLAKLLGTYATLGMAEDTWALNEGAIDERAFLEQARLIQKEREAMFFSALDRARRGVVACVFDTTDRIQHMFYRDSMGATNGNSSPYANVIEDLYRDMDRVVGRTLEYADKDTAVFVLSDHGFCSFRRGINLNTWLFQNGYLALVDGISETGDYFEGVDWTRTRAYSFGLGGIYLNLLRREARGIVSVDEAAGVKVKLIRELAELKDPDTGETAILKVHDSSELYCGPYVDAAPDLVLGYAEGYRASWSTATGRVTASVFEDNHKHWSGDHCVDPSIVPGVLFANRRLRSDNPGIEDLAPTVLDLFGVQRPQWMEGRSLVQPA